MKLVELRFLAPPMGTAVKAQTAALALLNALPFGKRCSRHGCAFYAACAAVREPVGAARATAATMPNGGLVVKFGQGPRGTGSVAASEGVGLYDGCRKVGVGILRGEAGG